MIKPYYSEPGITIYHGDCRDILPHLPKVDLVLTDPPYGVDKADWDNCFPSKDVWLTISESMVDGASLLVFPGELDAPRKVITLSSFFVYQWVIPWYKPNAMQFGKTGYAKHSLVWWFSRGSKHNAKPKMIDVIVAQMGRDEDKINHPSPKPIGCIKPLVSNFSNTADTILDPFMGSGTTGVACKQLGRKFIGIEIEEKYCKIAIDRLRQEVLPLHTPEANQREEQGDLL